MVATMPNSRRRRTRSGDEVTTTVTLPRTLLDRAKITAIKRGTSLKALIEEGIRLVLARQKEKT
jgi:hypothetical protein